MKHKTAITLYNMLCWGPGEDGGITHFGLFAREADVQAGDLFTILPDERKTSPAQAHRESAASFLRSFAEAIEGRDQG